MTSKNHIEDIQMFINEAYSDKEPLQDYQIKSRKVFNDYCNKIKKDLERLEVLEINLDGEKYQLTSENKNLKNRVEDLEKCYKVLLKENQKLKEKVKTYEGLLHTIEEEVLGE